MEVPLPTPFIAITQAVARRLSEQEVESLQQALTYQRRITRAAVRGGLTGLVGVLSRELHCDAVVLDEYGAAMAASTRDERLLELVGIEWQQHAREARSGTVGTETEHGHARDPVAARQVRRGGLARGAPPTPRRHRPSGCC